MNSSGSIWQKWDLHVHTPASYKWDDGKTLADQNDTERDETCVRILTRMNELDVAAFCIMDYWTFDGFLLLRDYIRSTPSATSKVIFPGIEMRMECPTDFKLNTHVLFSEDILPETLAHFISTLRLGGADGRPPSRQNIIDAVRQNYDAGKLRKHGFEADDRGNDDKMYRLGLMTIEITRESVRKAMEIVGLDRCLLVQPYGTSDGLERLDWEEHPYSDSVLMKWADCFETRKQSQVDLFLGVAKLTKQHIADEFLHNIGGYPKPVVSGSDAHQISKYGVYPSDRTTWLKAQPTFKGLRQVCHEPTMRCFIGTRPEKLDHVSQNPTKYIRSLRLQKIPGSKLDEHWFDGVSVDLNPGLIAIIGNKGSGKSALSDILALAANSHCKNMEFLNSKRFKSSGNKAKQFKATITWMDQTEAEVTLDRESSTLEPERVRYLPQHFIEDLCNEIATGNETNFGKELRKVIFSHVPLEKQLGMGTLDDLLEYIIAARKKAFSQLQQSLVAINTNIVRIEDEISDDTLKSYRTALALKQLELEAHDASPPPLVDKPVEDPNDDKTRAVMQQIAEGQKALQAVQQKIKDAREERVTSVAQDARLSQLMGQVANFQATYETFVEDFQGEFEAAGLKLDEIVRLEINRDPLTQSAEVVANRLKEISESLDGRAAMTDAPLVKGLLAEEAALEAAEKILQDGLKAPEKAYQAYLAQLTKWYERRDAIVGTAEMPDTIEYLNARIKRAIEFLPAELVIAQEQRRDVVRKLHAELLAIRSSYEELYEPVQKIAANTALSTDSSRLEFDAFLSISGFESNFFDFISRSKKGSFHGTEESQKVLRDLIQEHDFNSTESVVQFLDQLVLMLTGIDKNGQREPTLIKNQLRDGKKTYDLYNYLFGLGYLDVRYTLRLGKKDISQLSPGEKGALLLVFYLLLDTEEIPIIIDQPEHNLDNESVVRLLVDCIRHARSRRQVIIVTHNPNLAVFCDADQMICCSIDKTDGNRIAYSTGAIEDYPINKTTVDVLEGTYKAFDNRRKKYHKPEPVASAPSDDPFDLSNFEL